MVRDGNAQRIDIVSLDQIPEIIVCGAVVRSIGRGYLPQGLLSSDGIDIAYRQYATIVFLQETFYVTHAHTAEPDQAQRDSVAWSRLPLSSQTR
jgi:hypothetical protein